MEMVYSHVFICIDNQLLNPSQKQQQPSQQLFYEKIIHYLSKGYAVIYAVENNVNQVVRNLSKVSLSIEDYIESGAFKIIDAGSFYSPSETNFDYSILLSQWHKAASSIPKKGFKGIIVMGMPHKAFFDNKENQQKLLEYEQQIAKGYNNSFQVFFCCYNKELLDKLSLSHLIRLLTAHQDIIAFSRSEKGFDSTGNLKEHYHDSEDSSPTIISDEIPHSSELLNLIENGLIKALGEETTALVFKTLKLVYKISREEIVAKPELFEEKIMRMFGATAEPILKMVAERIKIEVVITNISNNQVYE